jgi:hypothetical protein
MLAYLVCLYVYSSLKESLLTSQIIENSKEEFSRKIDLLNSNGFLIICRGEL